MTYHDDYVYRTKNTELMQIRLPGKLKDEFTAAVTEHETPKYPYRAAPKLSKIVRQLMREYVKKHPPTED